MRTERYQLIETIGYSIDPIQVARVEGALRYSGLASAVRNSMATPQTVDLRRLFPGLIFHGRVKFKISASQKQLFLSGSNGASRDPESLCECADVGNGIGPVKAGEMEPGEENSDRTEGEAILVAGIKLGGPSSIDPAFVVGRMREQGEGDNGVFMPVSMVKSLVDGPFAGVRFDLREEGFIGWKASTFIDISKVDFTPEPEQGRLFVTLVFRVEINGSLYVDMGKLGKIRVTNFSGEQSRPSSNTVNVGFYAVFRTGEVFLKPVLKGITLGNFDVHMQIFTLLGTPFGTSGVLIGYILDKILGQLVAWEIPIHLERELRAYMARAMFPILDAYYSAQIEGLQKGRRSLAIRDLGVLYNGRKEKGFLFSSGVLR